MRNFEEGHPVIKVNLYHDAYRELSKEEAESVQGFAPINSAVLQAEMSGEEFDSFLKDNDLITYRRTLKRYHDGMVCGEFSDES